MPSCAIFKSRLNVGKVKEYTDIAIVDIFLAIITFATIDKIFDNKLKNINLLNAVKRFFLIM